MLRDGSPDTTQFADLLVELRSSAAAMGLGAAVEARREEPDPGEGLVLLDAQLRVLFVTPAGAKILGRRVIDLIGTAFLDHHPVRSREALTYHLKRAQSSGSPFQYETQSEALRGWCEIVAWPVPGGLMAVQLRTPESARGSRGQLEFLSHVSEVLSASLDYDITLKALARLAVPRMGDFCFFDVVQEDGSIRRVAWEHADPASRRMFDEAFTDAGPEYFENHPVTKMLASGQPQFEPDLDDDKLRQRSTGPGHFDLIRRFRARSLMSVPLIARGRTLGALTFAHTDLSNRRHTRADLDFAQELAGRAGLSVDNARLYARAQQEHAEALAAVKGREDALEAVRRSGAELRFTTEFVPQVLWSCWADGTIDTAGGRKFAEYTGIPEAELDQGQWRRSLHPDEFDAYLERWERSRLTGEPFDIEARFLRHDGVYRRFLVHARAMRSPGGQVLKWFGSLTDIEDLRQAEESSRHSQKLESIGLLAGGIAHDFNNLLTGIMMGASHAMTSLAEGAEARASLEAVLRSSERAAELTRQLLAYSGKGRFVVRRLDLTAAAREITELLRSSLPRRVSLELSTQDEIPDVEGDTSQIQQILMNLVINGAEAIQGQEGTVFVSTGQEEVASARPTRGYPGDPITPGSYVRLVVRDTGSGMDAETMQKIFDPFFSTKFTGRGLGLAAVLGIVRGHGAFLEIVSQPGQGTEFTVLFPAAPGPRVARGEFPEIPPVHSGSGTVLVVDDEEMVRRMASAALQHYGYRAFEARSGSEALRMFREHSQEIHAVLLDVDMPGGGGPEVLVELKAIRPDIPVLLSSGYGDLEAVGMDAATAAFLPKPYTPDQLVLAIQAAAAAPAR